MGRPPTATDQAETRLLAEVRRLPVEAQRRVALAVLDAGDDWLFARGHWDLTEPGAASYKGRRFFVVGSERRLLCRLVKARGVALSYAELKAALGNPLLENSTVRGYACRLRRLIRDGLAGAEGVPDDPVRDADGMGFRLDVEG
jgi:hypothetical protein